jgi:hypothetical protein
MHYLSGAREPDVQLIGKVFQTLVLVEGGPRTVDTVQTDEGFWLVPQWIECPDRTAKRPLRIVSMRMGATGGPIQAKEALAFLLAEPMPASVLDRGVVPPERKLVYLVVENPELSVPLADPRLH